MGQITIKKADKTVKNAQKAADEAEEATVVGASKWKSRSHKKTAKKNKVAKRAAKRARKAAKRISGGENNDGCSCRCARHLCTIFELFGTSPEL